MTTDPDDRIQIELTDWAQAREKVVPVREQVFVCEQGVPPELELDELDPACRHAMAIDHSGGVIGTGRLLPDGHIGRMAVLGGWRGHGVGGRLLEALVAEAARQGFAQVVLNAQLAALGFYERFGFVAEGEVFMEAGIPHRAMRRLLRP